MNNRFVNFETNISPFFHENFSVALPRISLWSLDNKFQNSFFLLFLRLKTLMPKAMRGKAHRKPTSTIENKEQKIEKIQKLDYIKREEESNGFEVTFHSEQRKSALFWSTVWKLTSHVHHVHYTLRSQQLRLETYVVHRKCMYRSTQ